MSAVAAKSLPSATIAPGIARTIGAGVAGLGGKRALLVTDAGLTGAGITGQIEEYITSAGVECIVYDKVEANPTMSVVEGGISILRGLGSMDDVVIVSLGGGSSMDAAKAMAVAAPDGGAIVDYCMVPKLKEGTDHIDMMSMAPKRIAKVPALPIIAIPTTSGTASETNGASVLTDEETHRKLIFSNEAAVAKMTLLDPELTLKLPAYPTATCGMDALTHATEALTSNRQNPYSDSIAIGSIQLVAKWLPILMADLYNLDARYNIQLASHMAGVAFGIAGLGICHSVGHPLSALLGKAHGQTLSTMLPHVMAFNMPVSFAVASVASLSRFAHRTPYCTQV